MIFIATEISTSHGSNNAFKPELELHYEEQCDPLKTERKLPTIYNIYENQNQRHYSTGKIYLVTGWDFSNDTTE